jgi:phage tail P2-like protein
LAPALVTLDCLEAYFDPRLTPSDFLQWLAGWVALSLDQNWPEERQRALVTEASELYRWQGTARSIIEHIRLCTGVVPEVYDSGGVTWSATPDGALPGSTVAELRVEVTIGADDDLDLNRLDAIISAVKPAHIPHSVNIVRRARFQDGPVPAPVPPAQLDSRERTAPGPSSDGHADGQETP